MVLVEITKKKPNPFITKTNCYQLFKTMVYIFLFILHYIVFTFYIHCVQSIIVFIQFTLWFIYIFPQMFHVEDDWKSFQYRQIMFRKVCTCNMFSCWWLLLLYTMFTISKKIEISSRFGKDNRNMKKYKDWPWNLIFKSTVDQDFSLMYISFMPISSEGVLMSV